RLDGCRLDFAVRGQESEVFEPCRPDGACIPRRDALVGRLMDDAELRPLVRQAIGERAGAVGAAVVDQQDLVVVERGVGRDRDVGDGAVQMGGLVVRGDEDADPSSSRAVVEPGRDGGLETHAAVPRSVFENVSVRSADDETTVLRYSPITWMVTSRFRGPSNSAKMTD